MIRVGLIVHMMIDRAYDSVNDSSAYNYDDEDDMMMMLVYRY